MKKQILYNNNLNTVPMGKKNIKVSEILSDLKDDGWIEIRTKGSHRQFKHPNKPGKVTVNGHPSSDIWGGLLKSIEKQSGLKF